MHPIRRFSPKDAPQCYGYIHILWENGQFGKVLSLALT